MITFQLCLILIFDSSRSYGNQLCYTPMFHALHFAREKKYRIKHFSTCQEDRPLITQFCANDPDVLCQAAQHIKDDCDGVDINLGCPQDIARRGRYGAFLQDDWELIDEMVTRLGNHLDLPVSCKVRRFDDLKRTLDYARMLEHAGCILLCVHGRTREQRGQNTGLADWSFIKAVKECVRIPVVANGNIQSLAHAECCIQTTGADAVMMAEGNLYNPALLQSIHPTAWSIADQYLSLVRSHDCPPSYIRAHLFKLFHKTVAIDENHDFREMMGRANSLESFENVVNYYRKKFEVLNEDQTVPISTLPVPHYLCQVNM